MRIPQILDELANMHCSPAVKQIFDEEKDGLVEEVLEQIRLLEEYHNSAKIIDDKPITQRIFKRWLQNVRNKFAYMRYCKLMYSQNIKPVSLARFPKRGRGASRGSGISSESIMRHFLNLERLKIKIGTILTPKYKDGGMAMTVIKITKLCQGVVRLPNGQIKTSMILASHCDPETGEYYVGVGKTKEERKVFPPTRDAWFKVAGKLRYKGGVYRGEVSIMPILRQRSFLRNEKLYIGRELEENPISVIEVQLKSDELSFDCVGCPEFINPVLSKVEPKHFRKEKDNETSKEYLHLSRFFSVNPSEWGVFLRFPPVGC